MDEFKYYIDFLKELWSNRRCRAVIILALYTIFFTFIILGIRKQNYTNISVKKENNNLNITTQLKNDKSYEMYFLVNEGSLYEYIYKDNLELLKINNIYYKVFYNILTPYDINTNTEIAGDSPSFDVKFWRFNKETIANIIKKSKNVKTYNDVDGEIRKEYTINAYEILKLINASMSVLPDKVVTDYEIPYEIMTKNNKIIKASFNLTDYYHLYKDVYDTYKLDIEFKGN